MTKSIRLNEAKRYDIVKSVMEAWKNNNPEPDYKSENTKAANFYYKLATEQISNKINDKSISQYINKKNKFNVQISGIMYQFELDDIPLPITKDHYTIPCILVLDEKCPSHKKYEELELEHQKWSNLKSQMFSETKELIETCQNTGQLLEMWPQIEPLLPAYLADPEKGVKLPSIPVSRLNERLGLGE